MRQVWAAIITSMVVSSCVAYFVTYSIERRWHSLDASVVQTRRVELVDAKGQVRAVLELTSDPAQAEIPRLVMRDATGRPAIELGVDENGDGTLAFASEHWNQGAVVLGHLDIQDPSTTATLPGTRAAGGWGLQVRSPQNYYTGVGFFNSGRPLSTQR